MSEQEKAQALSALTTRFSLDLLRTLVDQDPTGNVFLSPIGMASALAMTLNGATGETYQAMADALGVGDLSLDEINAAYKDIFDSLASLDDGTEIKLINSLWGNQRVTFRKDFLDRAAATYDAWLSSVDFAAPGAADLVNSWVSATTDGRITNLVHAVDALTVLLLINVAVFKAKWTKPFEKRSTSPDTFSLPGGGQKSIQMMHSWGERGYFENEQVQAVRLPYGSERMAMLVMLPREGIALADLVAGLTPDEMAGWMNAFTSRKVALGLPQFKVAFSQELNEALVAMGMGLAFDPDNATFHGMWDLIDEPLYIKTVKHDTFLSVDEAGTEAIAASVVIMATRGGIFEPVVEMQVTRPFMVAIVDRVTGTILFLGAINAPEIPGAA